MKALASGGIIVFAAALAACSQSQQPAQPARAAAPPAPPPPADAAPAEPPTEPADSPIVVTAVENAPTAATSNCSVVVVRAARGDQELATRSFQDECEQAPGYDCKDSGEGCSTVDYSVDGKLELADQTFWWVANRSEWHDNGSTDIGLYGFQCGKIARVWSYAPDQPGQPVTASIALVEDGDWTRIVATVDRAGETETVKLRWDADSCRFVRRK
jgi:hypothetical protein